MEQARAPKAAWGTPAASVQASWACEASRAVEALGMKFGRWATKLWDFFARLYGIPDRIRRKFQGRGALRPPKGSKSRRHQGRCYADWVAQR